MAIAWINLSTRWSLSSVQATLNVIISILGTVGIWSFSRFWWQRAGSKVVRHEREIPLAALYTVAAPGDGWDVVTVLGRHLLNKNSWQLLFQVVVVVSVTLACMFSGPIAALTSRTSRTSQESTLQVLQTVKRMNASSANLLEAIVLWNQTIDGLNDASFPLDQLPEFLLPATVNWTYVASEWNSAWTMNCNFTEETLLYNVTATGNHTFYDPINAFPAFRNTYSPEWLDSSRYRYQADFNGWTSGTGVNAPFDDIILYVLVESDPVIDDRWHTNNETLELSMSALHLHNVSALNDEWFNLQDEKSWRPKGLVANASYTRFECSISRKTEVPDQFLIPFPWNNDTYSITMAYRAYVAAAFSSKEVLNITYPPPTGEELLRFYQVYILTIGTFRDAVPSSMKITIWMNTVQLSIGLVIVLGLAAILIAWLSIRYFIFITRHKSKLGDTCVPDGKMEWIVYAAKIAAASSVEDQIKAEEAPKDSAYLRAATFGYASCSSEAKVHDGEIRRPSLARVHTRGKSISGASPRTKGIVPAIRKDQRHASLSTEIQPRQELEQRPKKTSVVASPKPVFDTPVFPNLQVPESRSRDHSLHSDGRTLNAQGSRSSSAMGVRPSGSCEAISSGSCTYQPVVVEDERRPENPTAL